MTYKIKSIEPTLTQYITMDDGTEFRRCGDSIWEQSYGESWETCYFNIDELEEAYQDHITKRTYNTQLVIEIRKETGFGLLEIKKALYDTKNDKQKSIELLYKRKLLI